MSKKILVTGSNGFLAKWLIKLLATKDNIIYGFDILEIDQKNKLAIEKTYNEIKTLFDEHQEFDIIFHLAAFIPYGQENIPNINFVKTNIELTNNLALKYLKARFILASSVSVYGYPLTIPIKINNPINNPNLYGLSKLASEAIVRNLDNYAIIRFSSIIGPGMKTVSFIPKIIKDAKEKREITLQGRGERKQDYIDVRDAAILCEIIGSNNQNLILLGVSGISYSNIEVVSIVKKIVESNIKFIGEDTNPSFTYDIETTHSQIAFKLIYNLESTIKDMI
jgi:UDP-glucose 4-epimerase